MVISIQFVMPFPDACLQACYIIGCQNCVTAMLCEFADTLGVHHLQVGHCCIQHLQMLKLCTNLH